MLLPIYLTNVCVGTSVPGTACYKLFTNTTHFITTQWVGTVVISIVTSTFLQITKQAGRWHRILRLYSEWVAELGCQLRQSDSGVHAFNPSTMKVALLLFLFCDGETEALGVKSLAWGPRTGQWQSPDSTPDRWASVGAQSSEPLQYTPRVFSSCPLSSTVSADSIGR